MRVFILLIVALAIYSTAFINTECEHIYVAVEPDSAKVVFPGIVCGLYIPPPTGVVDGKDIVCVKCFHQAKQKLDYRQNGGLSIERFYTPSLSDTIDFGPHPWLPDSAAVLRPQN